MTNRNNDDVARALEALAAGEHHEETEHHANDHVGHPPAPAPPAQPRPAASRPPAPRPAAPAGSQSRSVGPAGARPAQPGTAPAARPASARPAAPQGAQPGAQRPTPPPSTRPTQPAAARAGAPQPSAPVASRPASPAAARAPESRVVRPAAPVARPAAPSAPAPAAPLASAGATGDERGHVIDDDDAVIVPAPDASVFLHKPDYAARKPKPVPFGQSLGARRTFIPILLTGGFIMVAMGVLHFIWHADNNPMGGLPVWLVALLFVLGVVLWGMAFANMMTVKHIIDAQRKPGA